MIRVGFIGVGGMGRYQAKSFAQVKGCAVAAGVDIADEAVAKFSAEHRAQGVHPVRHGRRQGVRGGEEEAQLLLLHGREGQAIAHQVAARGADVHPPGQAFPRLHPRRGKVPDAGHRV